MKATQDGKVDEKGFKLSQKDHDTLKRDYESLNNRDVSSYLSGLYVLAPAMLGRLDGLVNVESCAILFEKMELSGEVEKNVQVMFFGGYEYYFQP